MSHKICKSCSRQFHPHPQTPQQEFCSTEACQRERRRRSQQRRRQKDSDYRENDSRNHKEWAAKNRSYWKQYRNDHPAYVEHNRKLQKNRNKRLRLAGIANVDASLPLSGLPSGRYMLTPYHKGVIAKVDAWIVEITVLSAPYEDLDG